MSASDTQCKQMNDQEINDKSDKDDLDYSVNDNMHETLMKELCSSDHKSCIEWNEDLNLPNIEPILSQLNHRKLFIGSLDQQNEILSDPVSDMLSLYTPSSRNGLTTYSLLSKIACKLKLEYIKLCIDNNIFLDRCIGSMYGMGIGDATGAPLEFIQCINEYKKSFFSLSGTKKWINEQNAFNLKRGQWTDDAAMGLCIADSLIINKTYSGSDIRIRFWNWWENGYNNAFRFDDNKKPSVGLGGNISKSIDSMKYNEIPTPTFETNTSTDDSGNGSLMRLSPIPLFLSHCIGNNQMMDIAMEYAKQSSFTTHPGYIAAEACSFMSYIIIHAIHRNNNEYDNNVKIFLENITVKYLKKIEIKHNELTNNLQTTVKSKHFNDIKDKIEKLNLQNDATDDLPPEMTMYGTHFLDKKDEKKQEIDDRKVSSDKEEKCIGMEWNKIENNLNQINRQIVALQCIIKLIKSSEKDVSTERCWNWKCEYGDLGIDKTMINRGSHYNGYPNNEGYFGSYCMDGLGMALHSLYNSNCFGDAIMKAVNMLGDADSTGSIAGQLAGAWYGFKNVFYDNNKQLFLMKQICKWDHYEFGVRAILLYCIGKQFFNETLKQIEEKNNNNNNNDNQ